MNQKWGYWIASSHYHHLRDSKGQKILAVVGLWFTSASLQGSQLLSLPDREVTRGPPRTPVVPRGTTMLFVPHSHFFSAILLNLSCCHLCLQKLWNVSRDRTICLIPHRAWFSLGDSDCSAILCLLCVCLSVGWAKDSAVSICWHARSRGSWVPSTAPTQVNS